MEEILTGEMFAAMVQNGYRDIKTQYERINELNVFPVPDGDTGTNITATVTGGIKAIAKADLSDLSDVASKLASGMLFGARGNSGASVSHFFACMADGLQGLKTANITQFASSLRSGTAKAYNAVNKPVEGTILTVAREGSNYVLDHLDDIHSFEELFRVLLIKMHKALENTPNLLPVLKEAGVIDSGGAGLVAIIEGMFKQISGEEIEDIEFYGPSNSISADGEIAFDENSELEYGYCTEFIMQLLNAKDGPKNFVLNDMIAYFQTLGDSIVAIQNETIVKVHVHTKTPGKVIEYAQQYGEFVTFKMENMSLQHNEVMLKELEEKKAQRKKHAIVTVAPSNEIAAMFLQIGADQVISGGQTMNPSAEDFVKAFEECNADYIMVFPNNSNIILTAKQAADLYKDAKIEVVPTKSSIEAYSAISMIDFDTFSIEENLDAIHNQIQNVVSCEVTQSIRDTINNGMAIKEGDFIGIANGAVRSCDKTLMGATKRLLEAIEDIDDKAVITVFYGKDATEEDQEAFREYISERFEMIDLMEYQGNQSIYPFIIAVE